MPACIRKRLDGSVHPKSSRQGLRERKLLEHHETELCSPSHCFGPTIRIELGENGGDMKLGGSCFQPRHISWRLSARCRRAARSDRSGMFPQFIDEDPRVLAVVYGDRDQLHAALLKSLLERRHQPLGGLDPGPSRVMSARERDEIRVSERHAEIGKAVARLPPA